MRSALGFTISMIPSPERMAIPSPSTVTTASTKVNAEPVTRTLPPFYLPQALGHLLPRLVPLKEPKSYMFASWVGETREVPVDVRNVAATQRSIGGAAIAPGTSSAMNTGRE